MRRRKKDVDFIQVQQPARTGQKRPLAVVDEDAAPQKKTERRNLLPFFCVVLGILIIIYAFIYESRMKRREQEPEAPFGSNSPIQAMINELSWITPMPLTINDYSRPGLPVSRINGIVIHNIGNPGTTAEQNRNYFENLAITRETSVSSNFIIDMDGTIIQCIPVDEVAYASNHRNHDTLSIEVCHSDSSGKFDAAAYASLVRLTAWLCNAYNLSVDNVLRHSDVYDKQCPAYYTENEDAWALLKADIQDEMRRQSG